MSHWSTIKTQITDKEILIKTLTDLGYKVETDGIVNGYRGAKIPAEVLINTETPYNIGFSRQTSNCYEFIMDVWGVELHNPTIKSTEFIKSVNRKYAENKAHATLKKYGYLTGSSVEDNQGNLIISARKY